MKVFWLLAIFALTAVSAAPFEDDGIHIHGETGWYMPNSNYSYRWLDMTEAEALLERLEKESEMEAHGRTISPVNFYLYTQENPTKGKKIKATVKSISASNFNSANPTRFVIHGWLQSYTSGMNKDIRKAWLNRGDYNIIVVDWARARSVDYASSVVAVAKVGKKVANMIDFLVNNHGMSLDDLHVIGHSLGAHVSGHCGKNVKSGQIHTIVGLDTALPLFSYNKPKKRLASSDAEYVETIHTNGGGLGFLRPIGKGAFYPNGGKSQPGCGWDLTGACDHGRSVTYYAEAVDSNGFPTMKCKNYVEASSKNCGGTYSSVRMGSESNAYVVSGEYFVPVNSNSPFGMGF